MKNLNAIFKKFKGVDGALITSEPGTFYLSGYINDAAFILLTKDSALYFTDSRYIESAEKNLKGFEVLDVNREIGYIQRLNTAIAATLRKS